MHTIDGRFQLSAGDLVNHLACRHLTELNLEVAVGGRAAPSRWDPMLELLRERGMAHERAYIDHLQNAGHQVTSIEGVGIDDAKVASTVDAMRSGHDVIVQGALADGRWSGRTDILRRVEVPSDLGDWSYEVIDTPGEVVAGVVPCGPRPRASLPRPQGALPRVPLEPPVRFPQAQR